MVTTDRTHLKKKHADHHFAIDGFVLFRRDRAGPGRREGRVAVYVNSSLSTEVSTRPSLPELLWVRVQAVAQITKYAGQVSTQ